MHLAKRISQAGSHRENHEKKRTQPNAVTISVAVSVFPGEQHQAPRSWTERAYPRLIYYNQVDKGGHFAAWEQPGILVAEHRAAFSRFVEPMATG